MLAPVPPPRLGWGRPPRPSPGPWPARRALRRPDRPRPHLLPFRPPLPVRVRLPALPPAVRAPQELRGLIKLRVPLAPPLPRRLTRGVRLQANQHPGLAGRRLLSAARPATGRRARGRAKVPVPTPAVTAGVPVPAPVVHRVVQGLAMLPSRPPVGAAALLPPGPRAWRDAPSFGIIPARPRRASRLRPCQRDGPSRSPSPSRAA